MAKASTVLEVAGREVTLTSPDRVYFPEAGITKLDLVRYYLAVGDGVLRGVAGRPVVMKRFVKGITQPAFFQKRAPERRPAWVETVVLAYASGRSAEEVVVRDLSQLVWMVNLGCIDLNPHPVRADDLEHPDELRIDLDPTPGTTWDQVRRVALATREVLEEHGLSGWPKTSGSRGIHVLVRIERRWAFPEVRRAAEAIAREVARRHPADATARWWKEERRGVFLDFNQNAKDRTVASAYSVRPRAEAWVSAPLDWDEVPDCELSHHTLHSMPARHAERGDPHAGIDETPGDIGSLLELADHLDHQGVGAEPRPEMPLITIARAKHKEDALAGLERWTAAHPEVAAHLTEPDVLVDGMRGRSSLWWRIRINLQHVPEALRPAETTPEPDYDPRDEWRRR